MKKVSSSNGLEKCPKLRFSEFTSEWYKAKLLDVSQGFDYGMNTAATDYDGINKYIRITDIDETSHLYLEDNAVSPLDKPDEKFLVNENDILFARTGASVGKSYKYSVLDGNLYFAGFLIRVNVNKANCNFIFNQTLSKKYEKWVKMVSMRSGQPGINAEEYKTMPISLTEIKEQEKISNFLLLLDEKIQKQQQLVELLKKYKKGLFSKINHQIVKFSEDNILWKKITLKEVGEGFEYGMNAAAMAYDGKNGYIRITDIDDSTRKYLTENKVSPNGEIQEKYLVKENDILFARTGASVGKSYLYSTEDGLLYYAGFLIRVHIKDLYNSYFVFLNTQTYDYNKWIALESARSGQPGINAEQYKEYSFLCPSKNIQDKIASLIRKFDRKIELELLELNYLFSLKKSLLQQLFI